MKRIDKDTWTDIKYDLSLYNDILTDGPRNVIGALKEYLAAEYGISLTTLARINKSNTYESYLEEGNWRKRASETTDSAFDGDTRLKGDDTVYKLVDGSKLDQLKRLIGEL